MKTASMQPNPPIPQRTQQRTQEQYGTAANAGVFYPRQAGFIDHTVEVVASLQCKTVSPTQNITMSLYT
jgi:hypothetical protein